jgi:hypothetical protein
MSEEDKTFTDPIHHDILINHLETRVVDTSSFQKLRKIRQLGTAHLVYHGAEHSRFGHSLGALHMASKLIACVKGNRFSEITVFSSNADNNKAFRQDRAFSLVTRLAALLHDLTVIPFSHTLEKEGNLFEPQWEDRRIIPRLIAPQSEIYRKVADYARLLIEAYIERYNARYVYDEAVLFRGWDQGRDNLKAIDWLRDPKRRYELEKRLCKWVEDPPQHGQTELSPSDCLVYVVPYPTTMYKPLETYVAYYYDRDRNQVKVDQLENIASLQDQYAVSSEEKSIAETIANRIQALKKNYGNIWKASLFLAEEARDFKEVLIATTVEIFRLCGIELTSMNTTGRLPSRLHEKIEILSQQGHRTFLDIDKLPETLENL